jgi:hypothetical protein
MLNSVPLERVEDINLGVFLYGVKQSEIKDLTPNFIAGLSLNQFKAMESVGVWQNLTQEQLDAMTPTVQTEMRDYFDQIGGVPFLRRTHPTVDIQTYLTSIEDDYAVTEFTPSQSVLAAASGAYQLNENELPNIGVNIIHLLPIDFLSGLTSVQVATFTKEQLWAMNKDQLSALSGKFTQVPQLSIVGLSMTQASLVTDFGMYLPISQMTGTDITGLPTSVFRQISGSVLNELSAAQFAYITASQLLNMDTAQWYKLSNVKRASAMQKPLGVMSLDELATMPAYLVSSLLNVGMLSSERFNVLTVEQLQALSPTQIQGIHVALLNSLSREKKSAFTFAQVQSFSMPTLQMLDKDWYLVIGLNFPDFELPIFADTIDLKYQYANEYMQESISLNRFSPIDTKSIAGLSSGDNFTKLELMGLRALAQYSGQSVDFLQEKFESYLSEYDELLAINDVARKNRILQPTDGNTGGTGAVDIESGGTGGLEVDRSIVDILNTLNTFAVQEVVVGTEDFVQIFYANQNFIEGYTNFMEVFIREINQRRAQLTNLQNRLNAPGLNAEEIAELNTNIVHIQNRINRMVADGVDFINFVRTQVAGHAELFTRINLINRLRQDFRNNVQRISALNAEPDVAGNAQTIATLQDTQRELMAQLDLVIHDFAVRINGVAINTVDLLNQLFTRYQLRFRVRFSNRPSMLTFRDNNPRDPDAGGGAAGPTGGPIGGAGGVMPAAGGSVGTSGVLGGTGGSTDAEQEYAMEMKVRDIVNAHTLAGAVTPDFGTASGEMSEAEMRARAFYSLDISDDLMPYFLSMQNLVNGPYFLDDTSSRIAQLISYSSQAEGANDFYLPGASGSALDDGLVDYTNVGDVIQPDTASSVFDADSLFGSTAVNFGLLLASAATGSLGLGLISLAGLVPSFATAMDVLLNADGASVTTDSILEDTRRDLLEKGQTEIVRYELDQIESGVGAAPEIRELIVQHVYENMRLHFLDLVHQAFNYKVKHDSIHRQEIQKWRGVLASDENKSREDKINVVYLINNIRADSHDWYLQDAQHHYTTDVAVGLKINLRNLDTFVAEIDSEQIALSSSGSIASADQKMILNAVGEGFAYIQVNLESTFNGNLTIDASASTQNLEFFVQSDHVKIIGGQSQNRFVFNPNMQLMDVQIVGGASGQDAVYSFGAGNLHINLDNFTNVKIEASKVQNTVIGSIAGQSYSTNGGEDSITMTGGNGVVNINERGSAVVMAGGGNYVNVSSVLSSSGAFSTIDAGMIPNAESNNPAYYNTLHFMPSPLNLTVTLDGEAAYAKSISSTDLNREPLSSGMSFSHFQRIELSNNDSVIHILNQTQLRELVLGNAVNLVQVSNSQGLTISLESGEGEIDLLGSEQKLNQVKVITSGGKHKIKCKDYTITDATLGGEEDEIDFTVGSLKNASFNLITTKAGKHTIKINHQANPGSIVMDVVGGDNETIVTETAGASATNSPFVIQLGLDSSDFTVNYHSNVLTIDGSMEINGKTVHQTLRYGFDAEDNTLGNAIIAVSNSSSSSSLTSGVFSRYVSARELMRQFNADFFGLTEGSGVTLLSNENVTYALEDLLIKIPFSFDVEYQARELNLFFTDWNALDEHTQEIYRQISMSIVNSVEVNDVKNISVDFFKYCLSANDIKALTTTFISGLTKDQILAIPKEVRDVLSVAQVTAISSGTKGALNSYLSSLTPVDFTRVTGITLLANVTVSPFDADWEVFLNPAHVEGRPVIRVPKTNLSLSLTVDNIPNLALLQVQLITKEQLNQLTVEQIQAFTPEQVWSMLPNQIAELFDSSQIRWVSTLAQKGLSKKQVENVRLDILISAPIWGAVQEDLQAISVEDFMRIPAQTVADLSDIQLGWLTPAQVMNLTWDQYYTLNEAQRALIQKPFVVQLNEGSVSDIQGLDLSLLSSQWIKILSPLGFKIFTRDQVRSLSESQVKALNVEVIASLNKDDIAKFTSQQIAYFTPNMLFVLQDEVKAKIVETMPTIQQNPSNQTALALLKDVSNNALRDNSNLKYFYFYSGLILSTNVYNLWLQTPSYIGQNYLMGQINTLGEALEAGDMFLRREDVLRYFADNPNNIFGFSNDYFRQITNTVGNIVSFHPVFPSQVLIYFLKVGNINRITQYYQNLRDQENVIAQMDQLDIKYLPLAFVLMGWANVYLFSNSNNTDPRVLVENLALAIVNSPYSVLSLILCTKNLLGNFNPRADNPAVQFPIWLNLNANLFDFMGEFDNEDAIPDAIEYWENGANLYWPALGTQPVIPFVNYAAILGPYASVVNRLQWSYYAFLLYDMINDVSDMEEASVPSSLFLALDICAKLLPVIAIFSDAPIPAPWIFMFLMLERNLDHSFEISRLLDKSDSLDAHKKLDILASTFILNTMVPFLGSYVLAVFENPLMIVPVGLVISILNRNELAGKDKYELLALKKLYVSQGRNILASIVCTYFINNNSDNYLSSLIASYFSDPESIEILYVKMRQNLFQAVEEEVLYQATLGGEMSQTIKDLYLLVAGANFDSGTIIRGTAIQTKDFYASDEANNKNYSFVSIMGVDKIYAVTGKAVRNDPAVGAPQGDITVYLNNAGSGRQFIQAQVDGGTGLSAFVGNLIIDASTSTQSYYFAVNSERIRIKGGRGSNTYAINADLVTGTDYEITGGSSGADALTIFAQNENSIGYINLDKVSKVLVTSTVSRNVVTGTLARQSYDSLGGIENVTLTGGDARVLIGGRGNQVHLGNGGNLVNVLLGYGVHNAEDFGVIDGGDTTSTAVSSSTSTTTENLWLSLIDPEENPLLAQKLNVINFSDVTKELELNITAAAMTAKVDKATDGTYLDGVSFSNFQAVYGSEYANQINIEDQTLLQRIYLNGDLNLLNVSSTIGLNVCAGNGRNLINIFGTDTSASQINVSSLRGITELVCRDNTVINAYLAGNDDTVDLSYVNTSKFGQMTTARGDHTILLNNNLSVGSEVSSLIIMEESSISNFTKIQERSSSSRGLNNQIEIILSGLANNWIVNQDAEGLHFYSMDGSHNKLDYQSELFSAQSDNTSSNTFISARFGNGPMQKVDTLRLVQTMALLNSSASHFFVNGATVTAFKVDDLFNNINS